MGTSTTVLGTDLTQLKYILYSVDENNLCRADYQKAVSIGGEMLASLQKGYAEAMKSGQVFFQDIMGFIYNWKANLMSDKPLSFEQLQADMGAALAAGDFSKIIPSSPFTRVLNEDGTLKIVSYPLKHGSFELEGITRNYYYYVPTSYDGKTPVSLMFSFHGINSSGLGQQSLTKLDYLAEKEGFIMVYPDGQPLPSGAGILQADSMIAGYQGMWNFTDQGISDMEFVSVLIDRLAGTDTTPGEFNIDRTRIYATGMSNGGVFSHRLAIDLSDKIAAAVSVTGPLAGICTPKTPKRPITVIQVSGTGDPVINWNGEAGIGTISVDDTIAWWNKVNQTSPTPEVYEYPKVVPDDTTSVTKYTYSGRTNGTKVILYKVDQMGHTWPRGPQYLPIPLIGKVCNQIDLNEAIWEDIKNVRLPK